MLTVIVTAYNEEKYIFECLKSLENQTFKGFEVILVNDGSTDRTLEICETFQKQSDLKLKIITQENRGVAEARNNALKYINTKYLKFLDGDDFLEPNALEEMVGMAEKYDLPIIKTSYKTVKNNRRLNNSYNANFDKTGQIIDITKNKDWLVLDNVGIGNKLYRTDCFDGIIFPSFEGDYVPEDLAVTPYIHAKAGLVGISELNLVNYRRHAGSLTNAKARKVCSYFIDGIKSFEYLKDMFKKNGLFDEYKDQLAKMSITYRTLDMLMLCFVNSSYTIQEKIKVLNILRELAISDLKEYNVGKELYVNKNAFWWPAYVIFCNSLIGYSNEEVDVNLLKEEARKVLLRK